MAAPSVATVPKFTFDHSVNGGIPVSGGGQRAGGQAEATPATLDVNVFGATPAQDLPNVRGSRGGGPWR